MITETIHERDLLIAGMARPAADGARMEIRSPATGEVVGTVPAATASDIEAAVTAARDAFRAWGARTAYDREKVIRKATANARAQADEISLLMAWSRASRESRL
jgi:succinate-semialdehyde dehydrogenase/glutarate-semialdehyde dehydrogenase